MNSAKLARLAASTMFLGLGMSALGPIEQAVMAASSSTKASKLLVKANALLSSPKLDKSKAIRWAEEAVALSPNDGALRFVLGRAYLANGRFNAAETSFADALALTPNNGRAALNLALMKVSRGQNEAALGLLDEHRDQLTATDMGLAQALAGDTASGIATLETAARAPGASAQTRQNLALAYALANRWGEAKAVAQQDLAPEMVGARIAQWAQLAHPRAAWDQVVGVLGIRPVYDPGQPSQLALNVAPSSQMQAEASPPPPAPVEPVRAVQASVAAEPAPVFELPADGASASVAAPAVFEPAPVAAPAPTIVAAAVPFIPAPLILAQISPLKQAVVPVAAAKPVAKPAAMVAKAGTKPVAKSAALARAETTPFVTETASATGAAKPVESGRFVVQLGAFSDGRVAEAAWNRAVSKTSELRSYDPVSARVKVKAGSFYRLSVSGFTTREAAGQVCTRIKTAGGACFVRSVAGDTPLIWASRGGTQVAARR
jgi:Flp pilus assembly protein TadD